MKNLLVADKVKRIGKRLGIFSLSHLAIPRKYPTILINNGTDQ